MQGILSGFPPFMKGGLIEALILEIEVAVAASFPPFMKGGLIEAKSSLCDCFCQSAFSALHEGRPH